MDYDEAPYPEFETTWVRPEGEPCPGCGCCTLRLCQLAAEAGTSCSLQSDDPARVAGCPCAKSRPAASPAAAEGEG